MTEKRSKVLYVDDEEINLVNFRESLCDDFEIFTALSGEEALEVLNREQDMALVVSDQRMPGMKGVDLLQKTRELVPNAERIIITGYTDPQDIIASINEGHVYRYILKPWNVDELRITLSQAAERHHLIRHNQSLMAELQQKNEELEQRVKERTAQLSVANDTLSARIEELEKTKYELKTLQGLLSICCYCKKIKEEEDKWVPLEDYLTVHADILLSHGICPACYTKKMEELNQMKKKE